MFGECVCDELLYSFHVLISPSDERRSLFNTNPKPRREEERRTNSRKKTIELLKRTKFIINSGENPYNLFTIDAFNNHVNIIYERMFINKIKFFNQKKLFFFNFHNNHKISKFFKKFNHNTEYSSLTKEFENIKNANSAYFNFIKIHYSKN